MDDFKVWIKGSYWPMNQIHVSGINQIWSSNEYMIGRLMFRYHNVHIILDIFQDLEYPWL